MTNRRATPDELFTLGYEKRDLAEFVALLATAGVGALLDVRETAWSYKPGFSKAPLRAALETAGIAYEHAAFAGNPKALRAAAPNHAACLAAYARHLDATPAVVPALDALVARHLAAGRRVCLVCFERHPDDCHRGILAARWAAVGTAGGAAPRGVVHLAPDGCARRAAPEGPVAGRSAPAPARAPSGAPAGRGARIMPTQMALW